MTTQIKEESKNKFTLAGTVLSVTRLLKSTKIMLSTSPSRDERYRTIVEIVCFDKVIEQTKRLQPGDHIIVDCAWLTVAISNRKKDNKPAYLTASSVRKSTSIIEKNLNVRVSKASYTDINEGLIMGKVVSTSMMKNGKGMTIVVRAKANGRGSLPVVSLFDNVFRAAVTEQVRKGDVVAIGCYIKNRKVAGAKLEDETKDVLIAREFALLERGNN